MKRNSFLKRCFAAGLFISVPIAGWAVKKNNMRTDKGFKVKSGEARFGERYTMKGVTSNILDVKISGKDTDGGIAVFEQTGQTPNGGPTIPLCCKNLFF